MWCRGSRRRNPQVGDDGAAGSGTQPASAGRLAGCGSTEIAMDVVPERVALDPPHHVAGRDPEVWVGTMARPVYGPVN